MRTFLFAASAQALLAPRPRARSAATPVRATATLEEPPRTLIPAQGALLVTKWKAQVENDIALGFLPKHTHPDRSVQRTMFVKKAFDRAYADLRTFAAASQAGDEAVAKLGAAWPSARVYGALRNSEALAAVVALVLDRPEGFDVLHLLVTPDVRAPEKIMASERAFLDAVADMADGKPARLSAAAAQALLAPPEDLGFGGEGEWLERVRD